MRHAYNNFFFSNGLPAYLLEHHCYEVTLFMYAIVYSIYDCLQTYRLFNVSV